MKKLELQLQQEREARQRAEQQHGQAASQGFWQLQKPTSTWAAAAAAAGAAPLALQQQPPALAGYGTAPVGSHAEPGGRFLQESGLPSLAQVTSEPQPGLVGGYRGPPVEGCSQQQAELQGHQEKVVGHFPLPAAPQPGAALGAGQNPAGQQPAQPAADFGAAAYAGQVPAAEGAEILANPAEEEPRAEPLDGLRGLDQELNGPGIQQYAEFSPVPGIDPLSEPASPHLTDSEGGMQ